jgi:hypothetical protein
MPKQFVLMCLSFIVICLGLLTVEAQQSAFTYQGKLTDNGSPANGNYDLQFALFDNASGGAQIAQTQTVNNVSASGGVFTVTLDFGANAFPGAARFLEISTRPSGGGAFTLLTPRPAQEPEIKNAEWVTISYANGSIQSIKKGERSKKNRTAARPTGATGPAVQSAPNPY